MLTHAQLQANIEGINKAFNARRSTLKSESVVHVSDVIAATDGAVCCSVLA
jgi:hypothetical protein